MFLFLYTALCDCLPVKVLIHLFIIADADTAMTSKKKSKCTVILK